MILDGDHAPMTRFLFSPEAARDLWSFVEDDLSDDESPDVNFAKVANALKCALAYYDDLAGARIFIDNCMDDAIDILLDQKTTANESIGWSLRIVARDLNGVNESGNCNEMCSSLDVLERIFDRKRRYYNRQDDSVWYEMVDGFQNIRGFALLATYLEDRVATNEFPYVAFVKSILQGMHDLLSSTNEGETDQSIRVHEEDTRRMAQVVLKHCVSDVSCMSSVLPELKSIFFKLSCTNSNELSQFFALWRGFVLDRISSQCPRTRLVGWDQISPLLDEKSQSMCPPPRSFVVSGAGLDFVNGEYVIDSTRMTESGNANSIDDLQYHRLISSDASEGAGKILTLFRCTMSASYKCWFISELDKDQPGTDADIDYYQQVASNEEPGQLPPSSGWITCRRNNTGGKDPAPTLTSVGLLVPSSSDETNTPTHQLAKWAIENRVAELVPVRGISSGVAKLMHFLARADGRPLFPYWRRLALDMVHSQKPGVNVAGWSHISHMIVESESACPPPRSYIVRGAGLNFINGEYVFDPTRVTESGYAASNDDLQYHHQIPNDSTDSEGAGKTITLFRCMMRSRQHKRWFISEPDEEQPRTDRDIDYYQHKSNKRGEGRPSLSGWITCGSGQYPAPTLEPVGLLCAPGEEENTPAHQLAEWALDNKLVELALGPSTTGDVVRESTELIKFLASMNDRFDWVRAGNEGTHSIYSLQESHLLFAQKSIDTATDAAAMAQMYVLLLALSPAQPEDLKELTLATAKNAMLRRIELNDPTQMELKLGVITPGDDGGASTYYPANGPDYERLGRCIGTNNCLKILRFDGSIDRVESITDNLAQDFFEGLSRNTSIKTLSFDGWDLSQLEGFQTLDAFVERKTKLSDLTLSDCVLGGSINTLVSALRGCTSLKSVSLARNNIGDAGLVEVVGAISEHRELNTLLLSGNSFARIDPIADLLRDPMCNLVTLELSNNRINDNGAVLLAFALCKNSKLSIICLRNNDFVWGGAVDGAFTQLICDTSSVNATYQSNHTLECVDSSVFRRFSWMDLNCNPDKSQVAMKKIIRHHPQIDITPLFEWDVKVLPLAISWFDKAKSLCCNAAKQRDMAANKLSAIYQFTRAMPLLIAPAWRGRTRGSRKRKLA